MQIRSIVRIFLDVKVVNKMFKNILQMLLTFGKMCGIITVKQEMIYTVPEKQLT